MRWRQVTIQTESGSVDAIAPEILSASRSTDIPAFYAEWFMHRLREGYSKWINPFNRSPQYISYARVRAIVFWSKNPAPLIPLLRELDARGIVYYFQYTLNDYEAEQFEPGVPPLASRYDTFKRLSDLIGPERVLWRFDPLLLSDRTSFDQLVQKVQTVGSVLHPYTRKLIFSFADIASYRKVQNNLRRLGIHCREFDESEMLSAGEAIASMCAAWKISAFTCGEKIDLSKHGISHNKCIDDELLLKISNNHPDLVQLFGFTAAQQLQLFSSVCKAKSPKDSGQRIECECVVSKDIGQYNTCPHLCAYCYANTSEDAVRKTIANFSPSGPSIIPIP